MFLVVSQTIIREGIIMFKKLFLMSVLLIFTQAHPMQMPPREAIEASVAMANKCPQHIQHIANLMINWIKCLGEGAYRYVEAFLQAHGPVIAEKVREILRARGYNI
jgi:hypothetical protein